MSLADQTVWRGRERVELTPKATAIFCYLIENAGKLVTHDQLLHAAWPGTAVQREALKVNIFELRRALGDDAGNPRYIETLPRRGYRLIAQVAPAGSERTAPFDTDTIFDREDEIQQLLAEFQHASRGTRRMVFVCGEVGVGKSAFVQEFLRRTKSPGVYVARGEALQVRSHQEPYYPLLEALPRLEIPDLQPLLEIHAPAWLARLPSLWPSQGWSPTGAARLNAGAESMLREICGFLEVISAEHTVVLVLEDLHWADASTIDFLSAFARRLEAANLLLLCTFRRGYGTHTRSLVSDLSGELGLKRLCRNIELGGLPGAAVRDLLIQMLPDEGIPGAIVEAVISYTGGNPMYIKSLEHQLRANLDLNVSGWTDESRGAGIELPKSVQDLALTGFYTLSPAEQRLLEFAAVVGQMFPVWAVSAIAAIPAEEVEAAFEDLAGDREILRRAGDEDLPDGTRSQRFEFRRGLERDAIATRMQVPDRLRAQALLGQAAEDVGSERTVRTTEFAWRDGAERRRNRH